MKEFERNNELTYAQNSYYEKNSFVGKEPSIQSIPAYDEIKHLLPRPVFDGHDEYISCYDYAWKTAFSNLRHPFEGSGFVSDFIDTAFNGCLFMWDSSFILMFTKYANRVFPFQGTLDNFYALQHKDGFICREINEKTGNDRFTRHDPSSTGPNIMPWCEWQYFENFGDIERLRRVYAPLRAYHVWFRENRTWRDGAYFSSGWGCGMDNIPRMKKGYDVRFSHGHMVWLDTCLQAVLNCNMLIKMNAALGGEDDVSDLVAERERLTKLINEQLWDDKTGFYYDLWETGELNGVKHLGAYWSLLSGVADTERAKKLIAHLKDENEFYRPTPIPTLSKDHPAYSKTGSYWRGGVWAPTNYMVLSGLVKNGEVALARDIAERYLAAVVKVFEKDGTLYENYSAELLEKGNPAKSEFVGWTGLAPISIFFEFVLGIRADVPSGKVIWNVGQTERHGILKYPFGNNNTLDLICEARESEDDEPIISVSAKEPIDLLVRWGNNEKLIHAQASK